MRDPMPNARHVFILLVGTILSVSVAAFAAAQTQEPKPPLPGTPVADATPISTDSLSSGLTDSTDETFWQGPNWGVMVDWEPEEWMYGGELIDEGFDGLHLRTLTAGVFIEVYEGFAGDAEACLADSERQLDETPGITDVVPVSDRPMPVPDEARGAAQMFELAATLADGTPYRAVQYIECRTVVPGTAVVEITWETPVGAFDEALPAAEALFATIQIPGAPSPAATPRPGQATPVASPLPPVATPVASPTRRLATPVA